MLEWRREWNRRLRPYLLNPTERSLYRDVARQPDSSRLGLEATVGIGYVTGDNGFFHLRPSEASSWSIPDEFLHPTVRNGRALPARTLSPDTIEEWRRSDEPMLLLRIPKGARLPAPVKEYLDPERGSRRGRLTSAATGTRGTRCPTSACLPSSSPTCRASLRTW